jgi:hypothetical protein
VFLPGWRRCYRRREKRASIANGIANGEPKDADDSAPAAAAE